MRDALAHCLCVCNEWCVNQVNVQPLDLVTKYCQRLEMKVSEHLSVHGIYSRVKEFFFLNWITNKNFHRCITERSLSPVLLDFFQNLHSYKLSNKVILKGLGRRLSGGALAVVGCHVGSQHPHGSSPGWGSVPSTHEAAHQGSVPSTHVAAHNCWLQLQGILASKSKTQMWLTYIQEANTHTHKNKMRLTIPFSWLSSFPNSLTW